LTRGALRLLPLALGACLLLGGCASLLERSYSTVEPYTNRYLDSSAADTLRAESYQDLVNSLLMLVEQQAEEGTIRCYGDANSYIQAQRARAEVRRETMLGSYLLRKLDFTYEHGTGYSTATYRMTYREGTENVSSIMTISDSQSLVDLLRLAVRENHEKLTARFVYNTPKSEVTAAVESLWLELCLGGTEEEGQEAFAEEGETLSEGEASTEGEVPAEEEAPVEEEAPAEEKAPAEGKPAAGEEPIPSGMPEEPDTVGELPLEVPDCPWTVRFYPDLDTANIVEILLTPAREP